MKTRILLSIGLVTLCVSLLCCHNSKLAPSLAEQSQTLFLQDLDSLQQQVEISLLPLASSSSSSDSLQRAFLESRRLYKKIEHFSEYFLPATSKAINGPPLDEVEVFDNVVNEPTGLQVIEELLYPFDTTNRAELLRQVKILKRSLTTAERFFEVMQLTDSHVFDAVRLQYFRILTLGITGFDTPIAQSSLAECKVSLASTERYLALYKTDTDEYKTLISLSEEARTFLSKNTNFDTFDRASFIAMFINPLGKNLSKFQKSRDILPFKEVRPLKTDASTLFAEGIFDANYFTPNTDSYVSSEKIKLGQKLFHSPILSRNNQRSCASCHQPEKGFTDGLVKAAALKGSHNLLRNTPTLLNAAFQAKQFYDLRTDNLENQSQDVIVNKDEMHGSLEESAQKLMADKAYVAMFKKAFPDAKSIQAKHITNALASYERSLVSFDSRFDKYMRGDKAMLSASEVNGFNVFSGKAKCGICHFTPLFNGTVPPNFTNTESEVIGVPATAQNKKLDTDLGRYAYFPFEVWKYAFKTPTLRNVEITGLYMHNGVYKTLEEVIDFYNEGGGKGFGFHLPNQTLPEDKLTLSPTDKQDLVAFLKSLTDSRYSTQKTLIYTPDNTLASKR
jgi:cytochrome c peroxidase